jgi:hypothetical protein
LNTVADDDFLENLENSQHTRQVQCGAKSSAGPEGHAVASFASIPDTPIARNSIGSHAVYVSQPSAVAAIIEQAARAATSAGAQPRVAVK